MRSSGIAPLLQKRLSGAIALALLIVAFAPQRTRSDASCFFPQGPQKSATPVDKKEKVPKDTLKGVAEHVKIFNERGILRLPPSETFNDLETDCDPLFHPYGSLFLAHDPLMFAHVSQPVERICGSQTCTNKMRAVARILRPKFPMKMQSPSNSATLRRTPGSTTLNYTLPAKHTHTPVHLSLDKSPVLGQVEQMAVDLAPVLMILFMVLFASGN